jgi:hypothetical protein
VKTENKLIRPVADSAKKLSCKKSLWPTLLTLVKINNNRPFNLIYLMIIPKVNKVGSEGTYFFTKVNKVSFELLKNCPKY